MGDNGFKRSRLLFYPRCELYSRGITKTPKDVTLVKLIHSHRIEMGGPLNKRTFMVNKKRVLSALHWLKLHNCEYEDIYINENNMDWIPDDVEEKLLDNVHLIETNNEENQQFLIDNDLGPAPKQVNSVKEQNCGEENQSFGIIQQNGNGQISTEDKEINECMKECSKRTKTMMWPSIESEAVNEYDPMIKLFCNIFPWLFPGGIGDYNDRHTRQVTIKEWIEHLMQYQDGRFEKDKLFCFYALNYMNRHRNQSSGRFFVRDFYGKDEVTLQDI